MYDDLEWAVAVIQSKPRLLDCSLPIIDLLSQPWLGWHNRQKSLVPCVQRSFFWVLANAVATFYL